MASALFLVLLKSNTIGQILKIRVPTGPVYGITEVGRLDLALGAAVLVGLCFVSAALRQSEICVKSSVFHTVFDVKFW